MNFLVTGGADLLAGQTNLSSCITGVADLPAGYANLSSYIAGAANIFASLHVLCEQRAFFLVKQTCIPISLEQ